MHMEAGLQKFTRPFVTGNLMEADGEYIFSLGLHTVWAR